MYCGFGYRVYFSHFFKFLFSFYYSVQACLKFLISSYFYVIPQFFLLFRTYYINILKAFINISFFIYNNLNY